MEMSSPDTKKKKKKFPFKQIRCSCIETKKLFFDRKKRVINP